MACIAEIAELLRPQFAITFDCLLGANSQTATTRDRSLDPAPLLRADSGNWRDCPTATTGGMPFHFTLAGMVRSVRMFSLSSLTYRVAAQHCTSMSSPGTMSCEIPITALV
jgi:hypothetical protein